MSTMESEDCGTDDGVKKKVDLDSILVDEIGQIGWYQLRVMGLVFIICIFAAFASGEYIFTTARIDSRCQIPECDVPNPEFAPLWILNAVPGSSLSSFESCERYANTSSAFDQTCPASLFDQQSTQPCDEYVYENTDTVVYDFDLACDEWKRSLIGSIRIIGTLTVLPLTGYISDRWGRRTALAINAFNTAWLGVTRYWADTYIGFIISEFAEATFGSVMELMGPKLRVAAGATVNSFFAIGHIFLGLIAWGVPNWRNLTLALYVPQLITIAYFWIVAESIRWLMSKGRYVESEEILKNIARVNGKKLSQKSLDALRQTAENENREKEKLQVEHGNETWLPVLVLRNKPILVRCAVSPIWWITTTIVYYGLSINAANMSGNKYLNYIAVSAVEIPGYWLSVFLMGIVGRKPVLIGAYWMCAACQIAFIFLPDNLYGLSLTVYLIGKFSIAMVVTSIYVYTAELYPTRYRHTLFAFSSMMGRIGSIVAPLTPALGETVWVHLPFVLFASFCILSGALIFVTPETLGTKLPNSMEDAANLGRKSPKSDK